MNFKYNSARFIKALDDTIEPLTKRVWSSKTLLYEFNKHLPPKFSLNQRQFGKLVQGYQKKYVVIKTTSGDYEFRKEILK